MKKLILYLAIFFFASNTIAQNILIKVEPATICPGGCTNICFRFNPKCKLPNQSSPAFPPQPMIIETSFTPTIIKTYDEINKNPKYVYPTGNGNDTVYSIPVCFPTSTVTLTSALQFTIKATGYCSTAYLGGNTVLKLTLVDCSVLGVEEQEQQNNQPILYYDLYGNRIEPRYNEVMIKQQGRIRTKIIIHN